MLAVTVSNNSPMTVMVVTFTSYISAIDLVSTTLLEGWEHWS